MCFSEVTSEHLLQICWMTALSVWMNSFAVNWHSVWSVQQSLHDKFATKHGAELGQQVRLTNVWMNTWELNVAQVSMQGVQTNMGVKQHKKVFMKGP
jgi:hypothetical protein